MAPRWRSTGVGAVVLLHVTAVISGCGPGGTGKSPASQFDCVETFPPDLNADALIQEFGASHVVSAEIPLGEGESERGTVIFPDQTDRKVEILWKFPEEKRSPRSVKISGQASRWTAAGGLTLGQTLDEVERRNGRPFELMGFGWDRGGAVPSWSGGALDAFDSCRLRARFTPEAGSENDPRFHEVQGDRAFASNDSVMRSLPLRVTEIWLAY